ncbi:MAG TPA: DUF5906 domain-containing protein [Geminicoccaceae bacterium]|nr:DUF5906 domain-containing protein [Geminicoccus sp.]HMU50242.1 DUF5906 domain-containing protein [Geminicoccaceae bacterium]
MDPYTHTSIAFLRNHAPKGPWFLATFDPNHSLLCQVGEYETAARFIEARGRTQNVYFLLGMPKGSPSKKPGKEDMAGSSWLWVDLDPRAGEDLEEERQRILKRLTTNLPPNIPKPTAIIDSGRGFWGLWQLKEHCADNKEVEARNRGLGWDFSADACHNIDRVARLPGTINRKTGERARLVEFVKERAYSIEEFPRREDPELANPVDFTPPAEGRSVADLDELVPFGVPDLARVVINHGKDPADPNRFPSRSEAVHYVACSLVRCKVPNELVLGILTDPAFSISESIFTNKNGSRVPNPEKYATRQIKRAHEAVAKEQAEKEAEPQQDELEEMNSKHAVLTQEGGKVRVLMWEKSELDHSRESPVLQSFEDFRNRYCNRTVEVRTEKGVSFKPLGDWWLKHPKRKDYLGLRFLPGQPKEVDDYLNMWRGFAVEPKEGDWNLMEYHIRSVLASDDEAWAEYILNWAAWAVQNPDKPAEAALVLRGDQGTGKGVFARGIKRLFGQHGLQVTSPTLLTGKFNAHLRDCCLLFADEALVPGNISARNTLKTLITEPELSIEPKGLNVMQVRNRLHIIMASNDDWVVPAGFDERRFAVFDVSNCRAQDVKYFKAIYDELENGGLAAMLHDLLQRPLGKWHPRKNIPKTKALQKQKELSLGPEDEFLLNVLREGVIPGPAVRGRSDTVYSNDFLHEPGLYSVMRRSSPDLREISDVRLARALKERGCQGYTSGTSRGWTFPPLAEMRARWAERFGPQEWDDQLAWAKEERTSEPF